MKSNKSNHIIYVKFTLHLDTHKCKSNEQLSDFYVQVINSSSQFPEAVWTLQKSASIFQQLTLLVIVKIK